MDGDAVVLILDDNDLQQVGRAVGPEDEDTLLVELHLDQGVLDSVADVGVVDAVAVSRSMDSHVILYPEMPGRGGAASARPARRLEPLPSSHPGRAGPVP